MRLLKMKASAAYIGVSYETFRQYVCAGLIPAIQYPKPDGTPRRTKQFLVDDLDRFIVANRGPEVGPIENVEPAEAAENVAQFKRGRTSSKVYERGWHQRVARK